MGKHEEKDQRTNEQINELKRFLNLVERQIKLDDRLRSAKKWFQRWHYKQKWVDLQAALEKENRRYNK